MAFDFSLVTAPFRMQPGLRRLEPGAAQLTAARPGGRHLREKMAVLERDPTKALVAKAGFHPLPALRAIAAEAAREPLPAFAVRGSGEDLTFHAPLLGASIVSGEPGGDSDTLVSDRLKSIPPALRPAALLSLAFEEDFAIVDAASTEIPWLAVCLPSRWAPETKVGRPFAAVHAPVADNAMLVAAGESLLRLVTGAERWERFVWTISADPRLHQHPDSGCARWPPAPASASGNDPDRAADGLADLASLRSERQTFIPVDGTGQAVFTIRVESRPLQDAVRTPADAMRLHAALASMSPAVLAYRDLAVARDRLLHWLARRGTGSAPR